MVSLVWLFLTLNLINGLRASVYQMAALPSCVYLEFSRKQKKCVACSQSKLIGHFIPAGTRPSGKPSTPSTHIHSHARRHTVMMTPAWAPRGYTFSCRCKSSSFLPLGPWTLIGAGCLGWGMTSAVWMRTWPLRPWDTFHAPIASVFCLRSSCPAVWLLIPTLTAFSARWKDCPLLVSSSFKNKFLQSRNSPSGNSFCSFFVPTAACIICQYDDFFFLSLNRKINHSSTESNRQFTTGDSSPKAALVPSRYLSSLLHSPSLSPYTVCPLA